MKDWFIRYKFEIWKKKKKFGSPFVFHTSDSIYNLENMMYISYAGEIYLSCMELM